MGGIIHSESGTITFRRERITFEIISEARSLLESHWDEIGSPGFAGVFLDPDLEKYIQLEAQGYAYAGAMRCNGLLVGYVVLVADNHPHHKNLIIAKTDILYIKPEFRGKYFKKFIDFLETEMKKMNVGILSFSISPVFDFSPVMKRYKYKLIETAYGKDLRSK